MASPHILILPMPFQGHVMPLMEMARHLVDAGCIVSFVNTDFNHRRLLAAADSNTFPSDTSRLRLFGVPDGMGSDEERKDLGRICRLIPSGMAPGVEAIIQAAANDGLPVNWMLADQNMAWAFPMAKRMGLRAATFWPASAAMIAVMVNIVKLIEAGVLAEDGLPKKNEMLQLAPGMPTLLTTQLGWNMAGNSVDKSSIFYFVINNNGATADHSEFLICNTFTDLEPCALSLLPSAIPIGPLFSTKNQPLGHLWQPENSTTILNWLDSHSPASVLYISFGSHAIFDEAQVEELAHGLELTSKPFLWAFRPDLITASRKEAFSSDFLNKIAGRGLLVGWAPQQQVLAHHSIGCFVSHCGWNSTMEGIRNGVRFLCWPYFTDQFLNQNYICDMWRVGLSMQKEKSGARLSEKEITFFTREEIKERVEEVMKDDKMKERALMWKEMALKSVSPNGSSYENFKRVLSLFKST